MDPLHIVYADGMWLKTDDGREILDGISGTFNLPLGYNHPGVEAAALTQATKFSFLSSDLRYEAQDNLIAKLLKLGEPLGLDAVKLRDVTGSTAIEFAIKMAQAFTKSSGIISFQGSHHGQTITTIGISGMDFRKTGIPSTNLNYSYVVPMNASLELIEHTLTSNFSPTGIAAIIVEPILGNGGNIPHAPGYLKDLAELCNNLGIFLIVDEVQTGIGRLGSPLACIRYEINADIVVLGKGLGNGYPIAAVLYNEHHNVLKHEQHSFTYGAHPVSVAAADAVLSQVTMQPEFLKGVENLSLHLKKKLNQLVEEDSTGLVREIRGDGMMYGVVVSSANVANEIAKVALHKHSLRLRTSQDGRGNVVKVRPALIATTENIDQIILRLDQSILDVAIPTD